MNAEEKILLVLPEARNCLCRFCEQSKWINHLRNLLPEKESKELGDWYNAFIDHEEERAMTVYHCSEEIRKLAAQVEEIAAA